MIGVHSISADAYHIDPCPSPSLSASIAKLLSSRTPLHAWYAHPRLNPAYEVDTDQKFDIGTACHSLILNDPRIFHIVDADDWRTKDAKAQRDEARAAGKVPLLALQWKRVNDMCLSARTQLDRHEEAFRAFTDGEPERTLI